MAIAKNTISHYQNVLNTVMGTSPSLDTISKESLPGFDDAPETKLGNYAFIKGPEELRGLRIDSVRAQQIILKWLNEERQKGNRCVGAFESSLTWLFEVVPNSVRFITDD